MISRKKSPILILTVVVLRALIMSNKIMRIIRGHWRAVLLILVYVRGVIVLFIYIASLSPYEKVKSKIGRGAIVIVAIISATIELGANKKINLNIFENRLRKTGVNLTLIMILRIIARIVPKILMNFNKGIKSSK